MHGRARLVNVMAEGLKSLEEILKGQKQNSFPAAAELSEVVTTAANKNTPLTLNATFFCGETHCRASEEFHSFHHLRRNKGKDGDLA